MEKMKINYIMCPEIKSLGISEVVVAEIYGVNIQKENSILEEIKEKVISSIEMQDEDSIKNNPILQSYRDLVQKIGRSIKKFPPAAESLIGVIKKKAMFPKINTAVDAYNIIVTKTYLALGVHDMDKLGTTITFRISKGNEAFTSVGSEKVKHTQPGDFVYSDEKQVLAWLDSKDSELVKISKETKNIVVIIQGTPYTKLEYKLLAVEEAAKLITKICGGTYKIRIVE